MVKTFLKKLLLATFLCAIGNVVNAQNSQEVVYLKNGSIIRGSIIEQKPYESLKIQTADGNVFVFKMDEVDKITKEKPFNTPSAKRESEQEEDPSAYGWGRAPRYRGFFGESYIFGSGEYEEDRNFIFTSHGVQLNPFFYVGAGVGVNYWVTSEAWSVPVFANLRSELHMSFRKNVSPYVDTKIGYSFADVEGFYFNPSVGCHFYFGHSKVGLGVGVGYVLQRAEIAYYNGWSLGTKKANAGGFELTVALDF